MPPRLQSPRSELIKVLARELGLDGLAELEASLVMHRPVPDRLLVAIGKAEFDESLSPRERQVMVLTSAGYSRQDTADELGVTLETVKSHLSSCYTKLQAHNVIQAVNAFLDRAA
jgi:DNA-binding NarL/FixJ family response regulator